MKPLALALPLIAASLFLASQPGFAADPAPVPNLSAGKLLFEETAGDDGCASCHGMNARGEGLAPDIRGADLARVRLGLKNTGDMASIQLSEAAIADLTAYLATLKPKSVASEAIPPGSQMAAGKLLFEETAGGVGCQTCHGEGATGTELGPDIRGKDETAIMQNLRVNQNMGFLELSTEDIEAIATYLAYLKDNPLR